MEPPTAREVIARLEREGWAFVGCTGDHRKASRRAGATRRAPEEGNLVERQATGGVVTGPGLLPRPFPSERTEPWSTPTGAC